MRNKDHPENKKHSPVSSGGGDKPAVDTTMCLGAIDCKSLPWTRCALVQNKMLSRYLGREGGYLAERLGWVIAQWSRSTGKSLFDFKIWLKISPKIFFFKGLIYSLGFNFMRGYLSVDDLNGYEKMCFKQPSDKEQNQRAFFLVEPLSSQSFSFKFF